MSKAVLRRTRAGRAPGRPKLADPSGGRAPDPVTGGFQ